MYMDKTATKNRQMKWSTKNSFPGHLSPFEPNAESARDHVATIQKTSANGPIRKSKTANAPDPNWYEIRRETERRRKLQPKPINKPNSNHMILRNRETFKKPNNRSHKKPNIVTETSPHL
jgi:hypothetical protein